MRLFPLLILAACAPRYLCAPGTKVEGEWCVPDTDTGGADTGTPDSGIDTGDTADTSDTGETGDTADTADTADTEDTGGRPARLVVNEFMTSNDAKAADELGEFDDWIEVYNAGGQVADLSDISLTDDTEDLAQYRFPAGATLEPKAFVVVWADGTPEQGDYHAEFTLQSAADRILLVQAPDGAADVLDDIVFTEMETEVSAARFPDGSETWITSENVTPGAANQE
ncbi:hypothetical protein LBMAG42_47460 [Deltaproteobacteria bacterium]|nr:hypothetical protein LBMAG42_47460 [Deltaproteobacteria bacterium]